MFAEPFHTPYDLKFVLFGFPVRVQALFWLMALVLTAHSPYNAAVILLGVCAVFFSILVHEMGHTFAMRYYGIEAHIVLYWMGGLAIPGSPMRSPWGSMSWQPEPRRRSRWQQVIISFAGPAAGFLLAGLVILLVKGTGGKFWFYLPDISLRGGIPMFWGFELNEAAQANFYLNSLVHSLLFFNIFWGLLNLLPVFPLDGGQISRELFTMADPWEGVAKSLMLSMVVAGILGVLGMYSQDMFIGMLFLSLAFSSYQAWQQLRGSGGRPW